MTKAKDIMSQMLLTAQDSTTIEDAVKLLVNNRITGLPVVDKKGTLLGVLSEYDIISCLGESEEFTDTQLKNVIKYTKTAKIISEDTPLAEIMQIFIEKKFRRLPVVNASKQPVGIITRRDIMRLIYYRAKIKG